MLNVRQMNLFALSSLKDRDKVKYSMEGDLGVNKEGELILRVEATGFSSLGMCGISQSVKCGLPKYTPQKKRRWKKMELEISKMSTTQNMT